MATRTTDRTSEGSSRVSGAQSERGERRERNRGSSERANRLRSLQSLFRDTRTEIRKVSWPDTQTTRNLTLVVIGTAIALGALLGGIDALFVRLWEWIP